MILDPFSCATLSESAQGKPLVYVDVGAAGGVEPAIYRYLEIDRDLVLQFLKKLD